MSQIRLYDNAFIAIFSDIINGKRSLEIIKKSLNLNILEDLENYLILTPAERFITSIKEKRNAHMTKYFFNNLFEDGLEIIVDRGLSIAIKNDDKLVILFLINRGFGGKKSLIEISKKGNIELFKSIYEKIKTKEYVDLSKILALGVKNKEFVTYVLGLSSSSENVIHYQKALYNAIKINDEEHIKLFMEKISEKNRWLIVFNAGSEINNLELVKEAINSGQLTSYDYNISLKYAIKNNNSELINLLINNFSYRDVILSGLLLAVKYQNSELINYFIEAGADNFNDALFESVKFNNLPFIEYFIKIGANNFNDALIESALQGNVSLIEYFKNLVNKDFTDIHRYIIMGGHYYLIDKYLPPIPENFTFNYFGPAIINFVNMAFLWLKHDEDVSRFLSMAKLGYAVPDTISKIIELNADYFDNIVEDSNSSLSFGLIPSKLFFDNFNNNPSLYDIILIDKNEIIVQSIDDNTRVFNKILQGSNGFSTLNLVYNFYINSNKLQYEDFDDDLSLHPSIPLEYIKVITNLNTYKYNDIPTDIIDNMKNEEIRKAVWREYNIIKYSRGKYA